MWFSVLKYEINIAGPALLQLIYLKVGLIVQIFAFLDDLGNFKHFEPYLFFLKI